MSKILSPGQKRKKYVQIFTVTIFLAITFLASNFFGMVTSSLYEWVDGHGVAMATVDDLQTEKDEYRNLKGRKRTSTVYYVSYSFAVNGDEYENTVELNDSDFRALTLGDELEVWYSPDYPYENDTKDNASAVVKSNNIIGNMISVSPYTAPVAFVLYNILSLLFVRESKKALPEGFYTQRSWLDIDDNYVVMIDKEDLVSFKIGKNRSSLIQEAYQRDATLDELIAINKSKEITRIPLAEITELTSHHNTDTISIEHNDENHSIEFLNVAVKAHALKRIKLLIPENMAYRKKERTRIQAMIPSFVILMCMVGFIAFFDMFLIEVVVGFIAIIWVFPKVIARFINPTVTEYWTLPEAVAEPA